MTTKHLIVHGVNGCGTGYVGNRIINTEPAVNEEPLMPLLPDDQKPKTKPKEKQRCGAGYIEEPLLPTNVKWEGKK